MAGIGATVALIKALAPKADPAVIQQAVEDYLEAHPEISVADGSITEEKLAADVAGILDDLQGDVSDVKNAIAGMSIEEKLLRDHLPGTTTTVTMDSNGNPTSIVHSANGNTVRTDSFVWSDNSVVETRTASSKYITITTNLETLAQTISDIGEVA